MHFIDFRFLLLFIKMIISQKWIDEKTPNKFCVVWKDFVQLFFINNFEPCSFDIFVSRKNREEQT